MQIDRLFEIVYLLLERETLNSEELDRLALGEIAA